MLTNGRFVPVIAWSGEQLRTKGVDYRPSYLQFHCNSRVIRVFPGPLTPGGICHMGGQVQGDKALIWGTDEEQIDLMEGDLTSTDYIIN